MDYRVLIGNATQHAALNFVSETLVVAVLALEGNFLVGSGEALEEESPLVDQSPYQQTLLTFDFPNGTKVISRFCLKAS